MAWLAFFTVMPFLVLTRFGDEPQILGWILGGFGAGAVAGSVVIFRIVRRVDRLLLGSIGEVATIVPVWLFLADVPAGVARRGDVRRGPVERPRQRAHLDDLHPPHAAAAAGEDLGRGDRDDRS